MESFHLGDEVDLTERTAGYSDSEFAAGDVPATLPLALAARCATVLYSSVLVAPKDEDL